MEEKQEIVITEQKEQWRNIHVVIFTSNVLRYHSGLVFNDCFVIFVSSLVCDLFLSRIEALDTLSFGMDI